MTWILFIIACIVLVLAAEFIICLGQEWRDWKEYERDVESYNDNDPTI